MHSIVRSPAVWTQSSLHSSEPSLDTTVVEAMPANQLSYRLSQQTEQAYRTQLSTTLKLWFFGDLFLCRRILVAVSLPVLFLLSCMRTLYRRNFLDKPGSLFTTPNYGWMAKNANPVKWPPGLAWLNLPHCWNYFRRHHPQFFAQSNIPNSRFMPFVSVEFR